MTVVLQSPDKQNTRLRLAILNSHFRQIPGHFLTFKDRIFQYVQTEGKFPIFKDFSKCVSRKLHNFLHLEIIVEAVEKSGAIKSFFSKPAGDSERFPCRVAVACRGTATEISSRIMRTSHELLYLFRLEHL